MKRRRKREALEPAALPWGVRSTSQGLTRAADGAVFERRRTKEGMILVNATANPLGWYEARGIISPDQAAAGRRLEADHRRAVASPHAVSSMGEHRASGGKAFEPVRVGMIGPVQDALRAVRPAARNVVWWVCCWGEFANHAAQKAGKPGRKGAGLLMDGLDDLLAFYVMRWVRSDDQQ